MYILTLTVVLEIIVVTIKVESHLPSVHKTTLLSIAHHAHQKGKIKSELLTQTVGVGAQTTFYKRH